MTVASQPPLERSVLERKEREELAAIAEAEGDSTVPWEHVKEQMRAARAAHRAR